MEVIAKLHNITDLFSETQSKLIKNSLKAGNQVYALSLPGFKGLIGFELIPNRRIGTELADVAKRFGLRGILHCDELPKYGITEEDLSRIYSRLGLDPDKDCFILLLTTKDKALKVAEALVNRLNEFINGVPKDTRQANEDGTTSFLRPRPGASRMYPETDHPLIFIERRENGYYIRYGDKEFFYKPNRISVEEIMRYLEEKLGKNLAEAALKSEYIQEILWALEEFNDIKPTIIAEIYLMYEGDKSRNRVEKILDYYRKGLIVRPAIEELLKAKDIDKALEKYKKLEGESLERELKQFIEKHKDLEPKKLRALIYREFRVKADMRELNELLKKLLN